MWWMCHGNHPEHIQLAVVYNIFPVLLSQWLFSDDTLRRTPPFRRSPLLACLRELSLRNEWEIRLKCIQIFSGCSFIIIFVLLRHPSGIIIIPPLRLVYSLRVSGTLWIVRIYIWVIKIRIKNCDIPFSSRNSSRALLSNTLYGKSAL